MDTIYDQFGILQAIALLATAAALSTGLILFLTDLRIYDKNGKAMPGSRSMLQRQNIVARAKSARVRHRIGREFADKIIPELGDGSIVAGNFFGNKFAVVNHPDMAKVLLSGHYSLYPKSSIYQKIRFLLGDGLVSSNGILWRAHRQALSPGFQSDELKSMVVVFNQQCKVMMRRWKEALLSPLRGDAAAVIGDAVFDGQCADPASSTSASDPSTKSMENDVVDNYSKSSAVVNASQDISLLTLSIICRCGFGYDLLSSGEGVGQMTQDIQFLLEEINARNNEDTIDALLRPYLHSARVRQVDEALARLNSVVDDLIARRTKEYAELCRLSAEQQRAKEEKGEGAVGIRTTRDLLDILMLSNERAAKVLHKREDGNGANLSRVPMGDAHSRQPHTDVPSTATATPALFTPKEMRDHCMTFMVAGNDTTSSLLQSVLYELCLNPEIQAKCHAEIDAVMTYMREETFENGASGAEGRGSEFRAGVDVDVVGDGSNINIHSARVLPARRLRRVLVREEVTFDSLMKDFPYLQQVVKETLRLYPPATMFSRRIMEDGVRIGEFTIKADEMNMAICVYGLHRHPDFWPEPNSFNPDRFSEANIKQTLKHPYQYLPFSSGARNCIGQRFAQMEAIVVLVQMLARFEFAMTEGQREGVEFREVVTFGARNLKLTVRARL